MSVYGSAPDDAPAMAFLRRARSESDDVPTKQRPETTGTASSGQGEESPVGSPDTTSNIEKPKGAIEVVSNNIVCYNGMARMAPTYIININETSSTERFEKCNSCDDLVKVFNESTKSWNMLRGKDINSWEPVSNK